MANVRYWHLADNPTAPAFVLTCSSRCRNLRLLCGMDRIVAFILAVGLAAMAATAVATIAHYGLGITRADIRIGALGVAGFIALGLVGETLFKRK